MGWRIDIWVGKKMEEVGGLEGYHFRQALKYVTVFLQSL